jgi:hypothetical protein
MSDRILTHLFIRSILFDIDKAQMLADVRVHDRIMISGFFIICQSIAAYGTENLIIEILYVPSISCYMNDIIISYLIEESIFNQKPEILEFLLGLDYDWKTIHLGIYLAEKVKTGKFDCILYLLLREDVTSRLSTDELADALKLASVYGMTEIVKAFMQREYIIRRFTPLDLYGKKLRLH